MRELRGLRGLRRFCTPAVLCLLVFSFFLFPFSFAFDSDEWHGKRELYAREAERLMAAYSNCAARVSAPAENVVIPVETYEDGAVKSVVRAAKAQYFLTEGLVWGKDVVVLRLTPSGETESRLDAKTCVFDRNSRSGWADGDVKVVHGKMRLAGKGVYFSSPESYVKVYAEASAESADLKFGGKLP